MAAGYKDFTAGAVLTAADLEDYCQNQTVMRFASASARDTALSAVKTEGMMAYLIDVNTLTVYSGSTWSTVGPAHGALTSWTPAITQSGSVTCTVTRAVYQRTGRLVWCMWDLAVTGSGSANNVVTISLPVTAAGSNDNYNGGFCKLQDSSVSTTFTGVPALNSSTTMKFYYTNAAGFFGVSGTSFSAALASGDGIAGSFMYEAASDA